MNDMNITSAQYVSNLNGDKNKIKAIIDGATVFVPTDSSNRHYIEIMRQVAAGDLTIADAD